MNTETPTDAEISNNAVSVYGQGDAMDDFPVLKAFQQYIDAEQAKAQKRTMMLCVFFAVIMAIVVGVFVTLLLGISRRNDTLNDQLFQLLLRGRDNQPLVIQPQSSASGNEGALKVLTESMAALQQQLADQQSKAAEATSRARLAEQKASVTAPPSPDQLAIEKKNRNDAAKLRKAKALLDSERKELAAEKERLRQKEIDLQRRKLYPELYEGRKPTKKSAQAAPAAIRYFDVEDYNEGAAPRKTASGALRYFDDDIEDEEEGEELDEPVTSPSSTSRTSSGWEFPLD